MNFEISYHFPVLYTTVTPAGIIKQHYTGGSTWTAYSFSSPSWSFAASCAYISCNSVLIISHPSFFTRFHLHRPATRTYCARRASYAFSK